MNAISPHAIFTPLLVVWLRQSGAITTIEETEEAFVKNSTLLGKRAKEDDVGQAALFLCSHDSGYISGHNLVVDGGGATARTIM